MSILQEKHDTERTRGKPSNGSPKGCALLTVGINFNSPIMMASTGENAKKWWLRIGEDEDGADDNGAAADNNHYDKEHEDTYVMILVIRA